MRVLYGVTGEGMGHAMRSRVIASHLQERGHDVKIVASGRACEYLRRYFDDVLPIRGLAIAYKAAEVARLRTLAGIGRTARPALREALALYRRQLAAFQPDACVTDFDSFSHLFGLVFDRPVISIDHQHVITRCSHDRDIIERRRLAVARAIVRAKLPGCAHYIVTSFYFPQVKSARTTLVGPILRPEVLELAPSEGDHVLVYQTGIAPGELVEALQRVPGVRFVVFDRNGGGRTGNVDVRPFDERAFLDHLAAARAVICNGGFTTMSEALFLGKRVLSIPLRGQGEQELNAAYLRALGLGSAARSISAGDVRTLLAAPPPTGRIAAGNGDALARLDQLLAEAA